MSKRYVGIDPSSMTGFYIQDEHGNTVVERDLFYEYAKDPERMIHIVNEILDNLKSEDIICIENFSYNSVGRGIDYQFGLGWVIRENLYLRGYSYYDVAPKSLKKFATGNGNANKKVMIEPIKRRFGFYHVSDNITDAFILSEIAKAIDLGNDYPNMKEHEKQVVNIVKNGIMNKDQWKKVKAPSWMNPKSKYYFTRDN